MSNNSGEKGGTFFVFIYVFLFGIMPLYAIFKDIQAGKIVWAVIDFIIFPLGGLRGLMYLFGG